MFDNLVFDLAGQLGESGWFDNNGFIGNVMKNEIAISELIAGLLSLVDGILASTENAPSGSTGKQNVNIVDALHLVRDRFEAMKLACNRGECSTDDFTAGMNAIMEELRSRTS